MRSGGLCGGLAACLFAWAALGGGCSSEGSAPAGGKAAAPSEGQLAAIHADLERIRDNMPALGALAEAPCPDDQIASWSPDKNTRTIGLISYKELLRKTGAAVPDDVRSPATDSLASFGMNWIRPKGEAGKVDERLPARWERTHYIGVIRKASERGPSGATALGGSFVGGGFAGWLVVFRRETGEPVCTARVQAKSSAGTGYAVKAGARADEKQAAAEHAVAQDLKKQVGRAMVDSMKRISTALTLLDPAA